MRLVQHHLGSESGYLNGVDYAGSVHDIDVDHALEFWERCELSRPSVGAWRSAVMLTLQQFQELLIPYRKPMAWRAF